MIAVRAEVGTDGAGVPRERLFDGMKLRLSGALVLGAVVVAAAIATSAALAGSWGRDALRSVVAACVVAKSTIGTSFPCADVHLDAPGADGYALIRSPGFDSEFLLTPLAPIDGIESPALQNNSATGFWSAAWATRANVAAALGRELPRDAVALAVNALGTRTQDHFHIHVDCLRTGVENALASSTARVTDQWTKLPKPLRGDVYWARSVAGPDLAGVNIPKLITEAPPAADTALDHATVAITAATLRDGSDGFYLLVNWTDSSAERLLDHQCRGR